MKIETSLEIHADIEKIWAVLVDIDHWDWNLWTRLEASALKPGVKGTLRASYEGDGVWKAFPFSFGEIDATQHLLSWGGAVAGGIIFSGRHHMRLERLSETRTRLEHNERFGGLAPMLGLGLPFKKLERNYRLMNEALKRKVEGLGNA